MDIFEYEKVKNLTYLEYCDYLQSKYGIGRADYMTKDFVLNRKALRTGEGLMIHHIYEDHAIQLSVYDYASENPYEWQLAKNLVYCDYLEHLFLHILIVENPSKEKNKNEAVGIGGIINHLVPQLNDLYSGWIPQKKQWRQRCFDRVKESKDVYLVLVKRFKDLQKGKWYYKTILQRLCSGLNEERNWPKKNDQLIFKEIKAL